MTPTANAKIPKMEAVMVSLKEEEEISTELESLMELPLEGVSGCGAILLYARLRSEKYEVDKGYGRPLYKSSAPSYPSRKPSDWVSSLHISKDVSPRSLGNPLEDQTPDSHIFWIHLIEKRVSGLVVLCIRPLPATSFGFT